MTIEEKIKSWKQLDLVFDPILDELNELRMYYIEQISMIPMKKYHTVMEEMREEKLREDLDKIKMKMKKLQFSKELIAQRIDKGTCE